MFSSISWLTRLRIFMQIHIFRIVKMRRRDAFDTFFKYEQSSLSLFQNSIKSVLKLEKKLNRYNCKSNDFRSTSINDH